MVKSLEIINYFHPARRKEAEVSSESAFQNARSIRVPRFRWDLLTVTSFVFFVNAGLAFGDLHYRDNEHGCHSECSGNADYNALPKYMPGQSYLYTYDTNTVTQMINTDNDEQSTLFLKGYFVLTAISSCYFDLTVTSIRTESALHGSAEYTSATIHRPLQNSSLRFRLENGTVTQVCVSPSDPSWSRNVKKSILSLLQVTNGPDILHDFKAVELQDDVVGRCYVHVERKGRTYYKSKDLNKCTQKEFGSTLFNGISYGLPTGEPFQNLPLLNSTSRCKQDLYNNLVQSAVCKELRTLRTFGELKTDETHKQKRLPSIQVFVATSLTLLGKTEELNSTNHPEDYYPVPIYFEESTTFPDHEERPDQEEIIQKNLQLLRDLISDSDSMAHERPSKFLHFKKLVAVWESTQLDKIYQHISDYPLKERTISTKVFLKAISQCFSPGAITFVELMWGVKYKLPPGWIDFITEFFETLKYAKSPPRKSLTSLQKLFQTIMANEHENGDHEQMIMLKQNFILSVSSFLHQYCKGNTNSLVCKDTDEDYVALVDSIVDFALLKLNHVSIEVNESLRLTSLHYLIVSLQALGNLDHLSPKSVTFINKCLSESNNLDFGHHITINAIEAFRRDPCQQSLKSRVKSVFRSLTTSSDLRIHSYRALMRCFLPEDVESLQGVLDNEQSNQVLSYIYSHVSNQLESSSPGKQNLKELLRKLHIDQEFAKPLGSVGKFSKNIEWSAFFPTNGLGFTIESDIVYSQESYIPRTATVNFTYDLFGRSYNFVETGIYLEGFEFLLNTLHAPKNDNPLYDEYEPTSEQPIHSESVPLPENLEEDDLLIALSDLTENEIPKFNTPAESSDSSNTVSYQMRADPQKLQYIRNLQAKVRQTKFRGKQGTGHTFVRTHGTTVALKCFTLSHTTDLLSSIFQVQKDVSEWFRNYIGHFRNAGSEENSLNPWSSLKEEVLIPTVSGIPISLSLEGSTMFSSKADVSSRSLIRKEDNKEIEEQETRIQFFPNVASTVRARMSLMGPEALSVGFQFVGNFHASAAVDISFRKNNTGFRISYNFPVKRFRVFELSTKLFWIESQPFFRNTKKIEIVPRKMIETSFNGCDEPRLNLGRIFAYDMGLKYCHYFSIPQGLSLQNLLLAGPITFKMSSEKLDPQMQGFGLDFNWWEAGGKVRLSAIVDAPGSSKRRRVAIYGDYSPLKPDNDQIHDFQLKLEIPSNVSPVQVQAIIFDTDSRKGVTTSLCTGECLTREILEIGLNINEFGNRINGAPVYLLEPVGLYKSPAMDNDESEVRFLSGSCIWRVGKSVDVEHILLNLPYFKLNAALKGSVVATYSPNGDFQYSLKNGSASLSLNKNIHWLTNDPSGLSTVVYVEGKLFNSQPTFGFEINSQITKFSTFGDTLELNAPFGLPPATVDLFATSTITLIPLKKLALETTSVSSSHPTVNLNFTFLTELIISEDESVPPNESKLIVQTTLENYWDIQGVRTASNTFGSLTLDMDVASWGRKLSLLTRRQHIDWDNLTQFQFQGLLKWDVGRDESKALAIDFGFSKNNTGPETLFASKNELKFLGHEHRAELLGKRTNELDGGVYALELTYTSPKRSKYSIGYTNLLTTTHSLNSNHVENLLKLFLNFPKTSPLSVSWRKLYQTSTTASHYLFNLASGVEVFVGDDCMIDVSFNATFADQGQPSKYLRNQVTLGGRMIPVHLQIRNDFRIVQDEGIEGTFELMRLRRGSSMASPQVLDKGTFSFHFKPRIQKRDREYIVEIDWNVDQPSRTFLANSFSFYDHLIMNFESFRSFKILNDGNFKNSPAGPTTWSTQIELSKFLFSAVLFCRPPSGGGLINVSASLEQEQRTRSFFSRELSEANNQMFVFQASSQFTKLPDFQLNFQARINIPQKFLNFTASLDQIFVLQVEHIQQHFQDAKELSDDEIYSSPPKVVYNSKVSASAPAAAYQFRFKNTATVEDGEIRCESGTYMALRDILKIDHLFHGKLSRIVADEAAENNGYPRKWYTVLAVRRRGSENEIPGEAEEPPIVKFSGPIYLSNDAVKSTLLLEWPEIHHSHILTRIQAGFSKQELDDHEVYETDLIVNFSGYDKKVNLEQLEKDPKTSDLSHPQFNEQTEAVAFSNFHIRAKLLGPRWEQRYKVIEGRREIEMTVESSSSSPSNYGMPTMVHFQVVKNHLRQQFYFDCTMKDYNERGDLTVVGSTLMEDLDNERLVQVLFTRNGKFEGEQLLNISSGLQWKWKLSSYNEGVGDGSESSLDHPIASYHNESSLCLITEKVLNGTEADEGNWFSTCALGFTSYSNFTYSPSPESSDNAIPRNLLGIKLVLLDKMGFRIVKEVGSNVLFLNSSMWLNSIQKPEEELFVCLEKRKLVKHSSVTPADALWGDEYATQFVLTITHPFFPKDLQMRSIIGPDPAQWELPVLKGLLELDIFNAAENKIVVELHVSQDKPKTSSTNGNEDEWLMDFYDMDELDLSEDGKDKPREVMLSVVSEGLGMDFRCAGTMDLSTGFSYSVLDRDAQLKEGKLILRVPSLLDSNVMQIGATPLVSVSFGGVPSILLEDPNSDQALILEYHGSPHPTFKLYSTDDSNNNNAPRKVVYSLVLPVTPEDEFMLRFGKQEVNDSMADVQDTDGNEHLGSVRKIFDLDMLLNSSHLLLSKSSWSSQQVKTTMEDFKSLQSYLSRAVRKELSHMASEILANVNFFSKKIHHAFPSIQPFISKLDHEYREDLEKIQKDSHSNFVYEHVSSVLLNAHVHAKDMFKSIKFSINSLSQYIVHIFRHNPSITNDGDETYFLERFWSASAQKAQYLTEEMLSVYFLTVSSLKKLFVDAWILLGQYLDANPELKNFLYNLRDFVRSRRAAVQNFLRAALEKTIALRPFLRYFLPKEAHEFLITLKHYSMRKLGSGIHEAEAGEELINPSVDNSNDSDIGVVSVNETHVLFQGYRAVKAIGRNLLERKGFLFSLKNESLLLQVPLPVPVRSVRAGVSSLMSLTSRSGGANGRRPVYHHSWRHVYQWLTSTSSEDTRSFKLFTLKSRLETAFFGGLGPDDAIGFIIGGKFFRTFDGRFHRFVGSCQYYLAGDMLNEDVVVHTNGPDLQELVFNFQNEDVVFHPNATVEYQGNTVEIPTTESFAQFKSKPLGSSFIGIKYKTLVGDVVEVFKKYSGIAVACLVNYPICSIRFKSHLFARGSGLLGTNNLEHFDDFSVPAGEIVGRTSRFYRNWRLDKDCKETTGRPPHLEPSPTVKSRCNELFALEMSPLRVCFSVVHPLEFQEMCESVAMEAGAEPEDNFIQESVCTVAAVYWIQCREHRVQVDVPVECQPQS